jgi:cytochrome c-type biogenesis protein CcmH/NrfG
MTMAYQWNLRPATLGFVLLLTACGGPIPSTEERRGEQETASYNQIMRVAKVTENGGDLISAANFYRRAHVMNPSATAPLIRLGETLAALQDHPGAAGAYRRAIDLDGASAVARLGLGKALINTGESDLAVAEYKMALVVSA